MKVSLDGLRANLSKEVSQLRDIVEAVLSEGECFDEEELRDAMNDVSRTVNVLCCVYDDETPDDFNDIGEKYHIEMIEDDEDEAA